ncbi:MAG: cysteine desulfurase NifS [Candidatus Reconcilbacillus cellulovorans]|uniref:Cysteine desulfurase NifS n=1 Tax=Candidatus Reconcilbacillus cellulovorans TaxID=1906605 RepID=A0A2A6E0C5_9BACL|nr:MAG: cysteine desulfurase NifS [Candidatus Reconcilbacillus cellulovorans]
MRELYFDHAATTPPREEVVAVYAEVMRSYVGNPSSLHRLGAEAESLVRRARETIASVIGVDADEIVFTSGGTESNNLAIKGAAFRYAERGRHLVTTAIEHPSVFEAFRQLESFGYEVTYLPVDHKGIVRVGDVERALRDDTILVSVMHVNNEVGSVQPIAEIGRLLASRPKTLFHVDAVQSFGRLPIDPRGWGVDLMSFSAHKFRGPKGAGFLYKRGAVELMPLLSGGGQEMGLRSGTEHVAGVVAMAKAARLAAERQKQDAERMYALRRRLRNRLRELPGVTLNGPEDAPEAAPHIVHLSVPGVKAETIVHELEADGIYISTQSACSSRKDKPSRVLEAMGRGGVISMSGLRISLSAEHAEDDVDLLVERLSRALERVVRMKV